MMTTRCTRGQVVTHTALALLLAGGATAQSAPPRVAVPRTGHPTPPPAPRPAASVRPIGTLNAEGFLQPNRPPVQGTGLSRGPVNALSPGRHRPLSVGDYIPLLVIDAPAYGRGTSTRVMVPLSPLEATPPAFYPTLQPPTWRIVPEDHPVQAWRLVVVDDVVCNPAGYCAPVTTRLQARWVPSLRGYAFRDRLGRIWRVE